MACVVIWSRRQGGASVPPPACSKEIKEFVRLIDVDGYTIE